MSEGAGFLLTMVAFVVILILFRQVNSLKRELSKLEETLGYQKAYHYEEKPSCDLMKRLKEVEFILSSEEEINKQWKMADETRRYEERMTELQGIIK